MGGIIYVVDSNDRDRCDVAREGLEELAPASVVHPSRLCDQRRRAVRGSRLVIALSLLMCVWLFLVRGWGVLDGTGGDVAPETWVSPGFLPFLFLYRLSSASIGL